jgi:hypothetical protein
MSPIGDLRTTRSERVDHPHIGWWVAVLGGLGMLAVLAFDAGAYAAWCAHVTASLSQSLLRVIFIAAVITHLAEAAYAFRLAQRAGLGTSTGGWVLQTFALGFPSLRLLRRRCDSVR